MNSIIAIIFWTLSIIVPPTIGEIVIPCLDLKAEFLVWIVTFGIAAVFLIRATSDALILAGIVVKILLKGLGKELFFKRAFRDIIYIVVIISVSFLFSSVIFPELGYMGVLWSNVGSMLRTITTYIALGIIFMLLYNIWHIIHLAITQKVSFQVHHLNRAQSIFAKDVIERREKINKFANEYGINLQPAKSFEDLIERWVPKRKLSNVHDISIAMY